MDANSSASKTNSVAKRSVKGVNKAVELLNSKCGTGAASLTAPIGQSEVFEGVVDAEISALRSVWTARIFDSF